MANENHRMYSRPRTVKLQANDTSARLVKNVKNVKKKGQTMAQANIGEARPVYQPHNPASPLCHSVTVGLSPSFKWRGGE